MASRNQRVLGRWGLLVGVRVLVRRRWYRGSFAAPKSRYGVRDVPITDGMARRLWALRKEACGLDDGLVFPSATGTPIDAANLYRRVFTPAAKSAGVPWATFHTLRHTCATMLFRHGLDAKQVQGWLGHHAASFTMDVYVHLLPDDIGEAPEILDGLVGARPKSREPEEFSEHAISDGGVFEARPGLDDRGTVDLAHANHGN